MNDISYDVIGAAIEVHKALGPGLLESCYEKALTYELELRGHTVKCQGNVPIIYKGIDVSASPGSDKSLRYDLLIDDGLIVELKSVESLKPIFYKQIQTYLKLMNIQVGLLFNFNVNNLMKDGFSRVVNNYVDE